MDKAQVKQRIERLKKLIDHHRYLYHVLDRQEISDEILDSLKRELYGLEEQFPEFITPDSPSQRVGGKPLEKFKKVRHEIPMLSLEDVSSEKELQNWENYLKTRVRQSRTKGEEGKPSSSSFAKARKGEEGKPSSSSFAKARKGEEETLVSSLSLTNEVKFEYFTEPKIDGFAIALIYKNGIFIKGATRGDGRVGEDVTQNLKTIESIPLKLKIPDLVEVRGEVYMEKDDFEKLNKGLKKKGQEPYANPRNLAAGSIRQLDSQLAASRPLKFLAYDIITDLGQKKHSEEHNILSSLGFKTDSGRICKNLQEVLAFRQEIAQRREKLPYQIDGIVVNVNNNSLFEKLGVAGKSPRGARALKFSPKQATTRILDIKLQIGRTGAVTPVALLQPVMIEGVIITRATLHNEGEIKRLGVRIGDTVIIARAGDVIPDVVKVLMELRTGQEKEFHFPKTCPICGTGLIKLKEEAVWRCSNMNCPARKKENLYYFTSKKAFDIEGLGPKIIDKLVDENLIYRAADIFTLKEGDLMPIEGFAEKSAENLIAAIQKSKKISLSKFIFALGIRYVGEETAIDLANSFGSIEKLRKATKEEIEVIPGVGPKTAESIYHWFNSEQNRKNIEDLLRNGIKILPPEKNNRRLAGNTFVLTGALKAMTRHQAKDKIHSLGGNVSESVSLSVDFLVAGENPGSKIKQAKKSGVKIINEDEFIEIIR